MKRYLKSPIHWSFYVLGFLIAAFGVFLMKRSTLGLGPWSVAAFELNAWLDPILGFFTFGIASSIHTYAMIIAILIINRNLKSAFVFISVLVINITVDVYDILLFSNWIPNGTASTMLYHGTGFILYCMGSAALILSRFPGMVIEEFTFSLMKVFAIKRYVVMRTIVAYFGFILALIYGFASGTNASSITILSFVLGVAFGPVIQTIVKTIRKTTLGRRLDLKQQ